MKGAGPRGATLAGHAREVAGQQLMAHGQAIQESIQPSPEGGANEDSLRGGVGDDTLLGQEGDDTIDGGTGEDVIKGGYGNDALYGIEDGTDDGMYGPTDQSDPDTLKGGNGDDMLYLGSEDWAEGGAGEDTFVIGPWVAEFSSPWISDYSPDEDQLLVMVPTGDDGEVSVAEDQDNPGVALVLFANDIIARVEGAYPDLSADDIEVMESDDVVAAT